MTIPRTHVKKLNIVACVCNPSTPFARWEIEIGELTQLSWSRHMEEMREAASKIRWKKREKCKSNVGAHVLHSGQRVVHALLQFLAVIVAHVSLKYICIHQFCKLI